MSFASPFALLWLAALVPVVAFYILKIRLRRVPVSTILFWRQIYDENQPRSIWQRMRHWLSLLAQMVLLLLMVGALADPFFAWETRELRRIVLIVDNSASMNATDLSPSRLSAAKDEAGRVIAGMRFRDELAVVAAGGPPRVVCGFSSHGRTLAHAVDGIVSTDNPTRVTDAVELARRLLGERQDEHRREIIVLTDVAISDPRDGKPVSGSPAELARQEPSSPDAQSEAKLIVRRFGASTSNVGITRFQVRRSLIDPLGYEVLAEVTNASDEPVECRLEIDLNDDVVDVVPLKLTAGQRWSQSFEKTSADGGHLSAKLDRTDSLATDNLAWAVLPKREPIPVTLVSEGNLFLQKVFESNPLVALNRVEPDAPKTTGEPGGVSPRTLSDRERPGADALRLAHNIHSVTVLHRQVPETLPSGSVLVIDPRESCDLWQLGEPLQNPIVSQQDKDFASSLLSHVRLDNVVMPEARQLKFASDDGVKVLARSVSGDPLLAIIERPGQKVLLLTVNLDEGDLPLRTAFPILMTNALNWFTNNRGELREALPTGAITEVDFASLRPERQSKPDDSSVREKLDESASAARQSLLLVAPDGRRSALPLSSERLSLGPLDQCGVWRVVSSAQRDPNSQSASTDSESTLLELACNLADRMESDIRIPKSDKPTALTTVTASLLGNHPFWFWLIALAWGLMAVEWWAYQRRVIE